MCALCSAGKHVERMAVRAKYMTMDPNKNKYVKNMKNIRWIQVRPRPEGRRREGSCMTGALRVTTYRTRSEGGGGIGPGASNPSMHWCDL